MSKTIRLEDNVYTALDSMRGKRETFSDAVARLLEVHSGLGLLTSTIQGNQKYLERQREQLDALE